MPPERSELPHHHKRATCRLCDSPDLQSVLSLTPTPPANAMVPQGQSQPEQVAYPLEVYRCEGCTHLQLLDIVDPGVLFSHYVYVSSTSPVMVDYLRRQCSAIIARVGLKPGDLVVEIGSNDGTLLRFFKAAGMRVLGVDPAANVVPDSAEIETITEFFGPELALRIRDRFGPAAAVCAYNVCAHVDDLQGLIRGVSRLISPTGHFVFEVGYLLDVYRKTLFDTIYHEHVDFHRVGPLRSFFARNDLRLVHAERSEIQGGALVGYVGRPDEDEDESIEALIAEERAAGLDRPETFIHFGEKIARRRDELTALLSGLKARGKTIAAYGAPAKATTLMYHFAIDRTVIDYIVDDNPIKQGLMTPGLHVPILAPETLYERKPDYVLLLAWNFAASIIEKHRGYAGRAGRFIVPLPDLALVGGSD